MKRITLLGLVLLAGIAGALLFQQPASKHAASNGATTVSLVKLPASAGGVSVGLTKLPAK